MRYATVLNTIFITAFYAPLIPIGLLWTLIGIFFLYWIEKFKLLNCNSVKSYQGATLPNSMTEILEWFLPLYCFANLLFELVLNPCNHDITASIDMKFCL